MYEFWRFVFVQQEVAKLAMTAIEYPPMQKGASFNLEAVKAQIEEAMKTARRGDEPQPRTAADRELRSAAVAGSGCCKQ